MSKTANVSSALQCSLSALLSKPSLSQPRACIVISRYALEAGSARLVQAMVPRLHDKPRTVALSSLFGLERLHVRKFEDPVQRIRKE